MSNNLTKYKFAILGGDRRQVIIANKLISDNHKVNIFGLGDLGASVVGGKLCSELGKAIDGCDVILLPLPVTRDGINLNLSNDCLRQQINLNDIANNASNYGVKVILGGMLPDELIKTANKKNIKTFDYYKNEKLQKKNALPSAEGALMLAMEHTEINVCGMKALICGYGRIGSCLSNILNRLGASVTVAARRDESLCEASLSGFKAIKINEYDNDELRSAFYGSDVVFNTVPHVIFNESIIKNKSKKPLYIEIASNPGGIDKHAAREAGISIINAPSLPGKYAPINAGIYIYETIIEILKAEAV